MNIVFPIRPATDIVPMLRKLADELEEDDTAKNILLIIETVNEDGDNILDIRNFGPMTDCYRASGLLFAAMKDITP